MPPPYVNQHWSVFAGIPYLRQGPVGEAPAAWAARYSLLGVPNASSLPTSVLDRATVRSICTDPAVPVLFGYVCAMAWGGQGSNGKTPQNVTQPWAHNAAVAAALTALRAGGHTRAAAYGLFLGSGAIPNLGPSFFTKLLYFFSPLPNFYIMDSRVAQAVILLTGNWLIRMNGPNHDLLSPANNIGSYRAFCEEVDLIAGQLACLGHEAEERLFSQGGKSPWPWRAYVNANWPGIVHAGYRFSPPLLHGIYPHIPAVDF